MFVNKEAKSDTKTWKSEELCDIYNTQSERKLEAISQW